MSRSRRPSPDNLTDELKSRIVKTIRWVNSMCEDPVNWLMTDKERISFIRQLYYETKQIERSEGFARLQLKQAVGRLSPKIRQPSTVSTLAEPE